MRKLSTNGMSRKYYRHFKGMWYELIGEAKHTETGEILVVYRALYKMEGINTFIRPKDMFLSEVDTEKYPGVKQKYRLMNIIELCESGMTDLEVRDLFSKENPGLKGGAVNESLTR